MSSTASAGSVDNVVARIERLPTSWWHVKTRIIVGVATFFDAFDALAIATVLPVLVPLWKLAPPQIGLLISAGFLGQLIGAMLFGWIGERFGRMPAMIWSIALFAVMSFVCGFAWDYNSLLVFRVIQGIGLGGEVPIAAVYISELDAGAASRPLCAALRTGVPDRAHRREPAQPLGGAEFRLAMDVLHRRAARASRAGAAGAAAGIAALARGASAARPRPTRALSLIEARDREIHRPAVCRRRSR